MSVIVTNAKSRIAYNIVRSLGEKNIDVITSDFVPLSMSFASKYSKGNFIYPSPFSPDHNSFVTSIISAVKRYGSQVLIPVSEETFLVSKNKHLLSEHIRMVVPDYDQILTAHNKDRWELIATKLGVKVPQTFDPVKIADDPCMQVDLPFPLLLKPKQGGGGWGMSQINSSEELKKCLQQDSYFNLGWDRFYLQRKIEGETHCVAMLLNDGKLRAKVAYKQLREYPIKTGQATFRISLSSPQAEENLQLLLEHLLWHGICQADFIIEKNTGQPYLIDLNPRFWGSLVQGIASGVDFPFLYYKIALEGDVKPVLQFKSNVMTRWIGGDMRAFFPFFMESPKKLQFLQEYFFHSGGKVIKDDFNFYDPLPFFTWYLDALMRMIKYRSLSPVAHESLEGIWE